MRGLLSVLAVILWLPTAALAGQVHALVIGIDRYAAQGGSLTDLEGAVNDARDIASAVRQMGAASLTVLLDEEANRDAILAAWERKVARAAPGDTLLVTYAGHGAQEPSRFPETEADGLDEVMVLGGFRETAPRNYERIFDWEWRRKVASVPDLNVVLMFDACHAGTMNRSLAPGGRIMRSRFSSYGTIENDMLPPPPVEAEGQPATLRNEVFIAATRADLLVTEVLIDGQARGAVSWLFAAALRGAADADGDGVLSRAELRAFIDRRGREMTERRQFPSVEFSGEADLPVFALPARSAEDRRACIGAALAGVPGKLPVALFGGLDADWLSRHAPRARPVAMSEAVLNIEPEGNAVLSSLGDSVAPLQPAPGVAAEVHVAGVVDKWRMLEGLKALAACQAPLGLRFVQGDGLHREGDRLTFELAARVEPHLTLLNIAGNGTVQFLYPLYPQPGGGRDDPYASFSDPLRVEPTTPFRLDFGVTPPFGGDHLVALSSRRPERDLHRALKALDGRIAPEEALAALAETVSRAPEEHELGFLALYTAPR
ncbi:MAG: caspase family protein [Rhodobacteraceae bacterium]|nr:caspase family protein [Paracoccaceae bacterium]